MDEERFRPYAAAMIFLIRNNQLFMLRRFNTGWADGTYTVPSGHIEKGEGVIQAAIREAQEEAGVTIRSSDIEVSFVSYRISSDRTYVDFFLTCSAWTGEPYSAEPDKSYDGKWFPLDNLPENTTPFIRRGVEAYRNNQIFYETD